MKELLENFEKYGNKYTQVKKSETAYMYKVESGTMTYYEVFLRKENTQFGCISYPGNSAFGLWAWCCDLEKALLRFDLLNSKQKQQ